MLIHLLSPWTSFTGVGKVAGFDILHIICLTVTKLQLLAQKVSHINNSAQTKLDLNFCGMRWPGVQLHSLVSTWFTAFIHTDNIPRVQFLMPCILFVDFSKFSFEQNIFKKQELWIAGWILVHKWLWSLFTRIPGIWTHTSWCVVFIFTKGSWPLQIECQPLPVTPPANYPESAALHNLYLWVEKDTVRSRYLSSG